MAVGEMLFFFISVVLAMECDTFTGFEPDLNQSMYGKPQYWNNDI